MADHECEVCELATELSEERKRYNDLLRRHERVIKTLANVEAELERVTREG